MTIHIEYQEAKDTLFNALSEECHIVLVNNVDIGRLMKACSNALNGRGWYFVTDDASVIFWVDGNNPTYAAKEACRATLMAGACPEPIKQIIAALQKHYSVAQVVKAVEAALRMDINSLQLNRLIEELGKLE